jgi:hypothetical protein
MNEHRILVKLRYLKLINFRFERHNKIPLILVTL